MNASETAPFGLADLSALCRAQPSTRILDVRTAGEFEAEHLAGSLNIPLDQLPAHASEICAITTGPLVLLCRSGQRARTAESTLRRSGMQDLFVVEGGMNALIASGAATNRGAPRMSLERQVRIAAGTLAGVGGFLALFVNPYFAAIPAFVGSGLVFAGVSDTCAMGMLIARLPYNRGTRCDIPSSLRSLSQRCEPERGISIVTKDGC